MTHTTAISSMHRPEGTALTRRGQCTTALVSVALAALAVGLGLAKRSWPIGVGLGGASLLVAGLGCSHSRRSGVRREEGAVAAVPDSTASADPATPWILNETLITVVKGNIAQMRDVEAIAFKAHWTLLVNRVEQNQSPLIEAEAGSEPFEECGRHNLSAGEQMTNRRDNGGVFVSGAGNLAQHGVKALVHMIVLDTADNTRVTQIYRDALVQAAENRRASIAISLATRLTAATLVDAETLVNIVVNSVLHRDQRAPLREVRMVVETDMQMRAMKAALIARRDQLQPGQP
jgi:O-acetyl-ADP-ribose deacetylase (regulator of RNase III)